MIIDTPGVREIGVWAAEAGVAEAFNDITSVAVGCRFSNCQHLQEPSCAVKAAVADGRLSATRLAAWRALSNESVAAPTRMPSGRR